MSENKSGFFKGFFKNKEEDPKLSVGYTQLLVNAFEEEEEKEKESNTQLVGTVSGSSTNSNTSDDNTQVKPSTNIELLIQACEEEEKENNTQLLGAVSGSSTSLNTSDEYTNTLKITIGGIAESEGEISNYEQPKKSTKNKKRKKSAPKNENKNEVETESEEEQKIEKKTKTNKALVSRTKREEKKLLAAEFVTMVHSKDTNLHTLNNFIKDSLVKTFYNKKSDKIQTMPSADSSKKFHLSYYILAKLIMEKTEYQEKFDLQKFLDSGLFKTIYGFDGKKATIKEISLTRHSISYALVSGKIAKQAFGSQDYEKTTLDLEERMTTLNYLLDNNLINLNLVFRKSNKGNDYKSLSSVLQNKIDVQADKTIGNKENLDFCCLFIKHGYNFNEYTTKSPNTSEKSQYTINIKDSHDLVKYFMKNSENKKEAAQLISVAVEKGNIDYNKAINLFNLVPGYKEYNNLLKDASQIQMESSNNNNNNNNSITENPSSKIHQPSSLKRESGKKK